MTSGVSLRSSSVLVDVRAGLVGYQGAAVVHLRDAERDLKRILDRLADLDVRAKGAVRRWTATVDDLEAELAGCEEDCDGIEQELYRARRELNEAETHLAVVRRHRARIEEAGRAFLIQQRRLLTQMEREIPKAAALLERLKRDVDGYRQAASVSALTLSPDGAADAALARAGQEAAQQSDTRALDFYDAVDSAQQLQSSVGVSDSHSAILLNDAIDGALESASLVAAVIIGIQSHREQSQAPAAGHGASDRFYLDPDFYRLALSMGIDGLRRSFAAGREESP